MKILLDRYAWKSQKALREQVKQQFLPMKLTYIESSEYAEFKTPQDFTQKYYIIEIMKGNVGTI